MDTKFMNSENSKTSDPDRLLLNLMNKTNFHILKYGLLIEILSL